MIGIAVGMGIHGYVPENFTASPIGKYAWWPMPPAVLIGVTLYFSWGRGNTGLSGAVFF